MNALELRGLRVSLETERGQIIAVSDTNLSIAKGQTLALVGESGAGKTMTGLAVMGLVPPNGKIDTGEILLSGRNLFELKPAELRAIRGKDLAMVFQDPMTALNPLLTIGRQLEEVLQAHANYPKADRHRRCVEALAEVGLPDAEERLDAYPHQLSGGQRQRVMIAMALLLEPAVIVADEPTTALDVTIQAQIIELLRKLQERRGTAILLITHDLGVVAAMAHRVAVMYSGAVVEVGNTEEVFRQPHHPYTFALLQSLPNGSTPVNEPLPTLPGHPPDPHESAMGCNFAPRCPFKLDRCTHQRPPLEQPQVADAEVLRHARMLFVGGRRTACFEQERVGSLTGLWAQTLDYGAPLPATGQPAPEAASGVASGVASEAASETAPEAAPGGASGTASDEPSSPAPDDTPEVES